MVTLYYHLTEKFRMESKKYFYEAGISIGSLQVDLVIMSKSIETFRICRACCTNHFGNKFIEVYVNFHRYMSAILLMHLYAIDIQSRFLFEQRW